MTGTISKSIGSDIYEYVAVIDGHPYPIENGDDEIRKVDIGKKALVDIRMSDPLCKFICFVSHPKETSVCI
jgi:hypothetical protein